MMWELSLEAITASLGEAGVAGTVSGESTAPPTLVFILKIRHLEDEIIVQIIFDSK